jgi:hypothetical protein
MLKNAQKSSKKLKNKYENQSLFLLNPELVLKYFDKGSGEAEEACNVVEGSVIVVFVCKFADFVPLLPVVESL